jgi:signal transduction histidine kinase
MRGRVAPRGRAGHICAVSSFRARLFVVWLLSLAAACALGWLMMQLYRQSATAQIGRAEAAVAQACERISDRYAFYTAGWAGPVEAVADARLQTDLATLLKLSLATSPSISGGIWETGLGSLAYRPADTEGGDEPPQAVLVRLPILNGAADSTGRAVGGQITAGGTTIVLHSCVLAGPITDLTAWTSTSVMSAPGENKLHMALGVLLALVLGMALLLTWLMLSVARGVSHIEAALAAARGDALPMLGSTGSKELDRIVGALNTAGQRLAAARRRSAELAARVAQAERLAALGRVAAGVAHEIRNPIAAMRLRAENALAGDDARRGSALQMILGQIARLDHLVGEMLAMTQRREPRPEEVDVPALLHAVAADHASPGPPVEVQAEPLTARLDEALLRRALDALLDNARRHSPPDAPVWLRARREGSQLCIEVEDAGPGIAPDLRETLFEPFVTGRAEGTGLGLAIARELAEAQSGTLTLARAGGGRPGEGAKFVLDLPLEVACTPS